MAMGVMAVVGGHHANASLLTGIKPHPLDRFVQWLHPRVCHSINRDESCLRSNVSLGASPALKHFLAIAELPFRFGKNRLSRDFIRDQSGDQFAIQSSQNCFYLLLTTRDTNDQPLSRLLQGDTGNTTIGSLL